MVKIVLMTMMINADAHWCFVVVLGVIAVVVGVATAVVVENDDVTT